MPESSRMLIDDYCFRYSKSKKTKRLQDILFRTYDPNALFNRDDILFVDGLVFNESYPKMLKALQDLYNYISQHGTLETET